MYDNKEITMDFKMRFGDFGVLPAVVLGAEPHPFQYGDTLDLVKYSKYDDGHETNYVIGRWSPDSEGYVFSSCGDRLFTCVEEYELANVWSMCKAVQGFLDRVFQ